jgi:hypothetical protein
MAVKGIYLGNAQLQAARKKVEGAMVELDGEWYYRIDNYESMEDFFMTIVSPSDHWMYLSSNGSLSAGRINRNNAFFPYYTVDKIHDYKGLTGPATWCLVKHEGKDFLWEPFTGSSERFYTINKSLYKSIYGNKVLFEEHNEDLGLTFRYGWYNSENHGWIRKARIVNMGNSAIQISLLDGLRNLLPYGADYSFQTEYSNLMDAYKKNELLPKSRLGLYLLSSIPVDRAEPSEALKATTVWSYGLGEDLRILLSDRQLAAFLGGEEVTAELDVRAARGAYLMQADLELGPGEADEWGQVVEINQDATQVADLDAFLRDNDALKKVLDQEIEQGTRELIGVVASADGMQLGQDKLNCARHFANTLYNIMRGGVYTENYLVERRDLMHYLGQCNARILEDHRQALLALPEKLPYPALLQWVRSEDRPGLERLCMEYLPLTFSRRHGDPSRPWNQFSIEVRNEDGSDKLSYQGNWRDIFQNWEALNLSFPEFLEGILAKFLNASTPDGYNPYRITREGIDWECPDPEDPWAYIGYWGDHQIIYLQKFLEQSRDFYPGQLEKLLDRELFVFANVPYRIKDFEKLLANPKDTIDFDHELNRKIEEQVQQMGSDGKLLRGKEDQLQRANLTEKILITLLAKLSNFIPEAGIWLNTQRPEWNDANNALVGSGVSMVTLYYIRRFLAFWVDQFGNAGLDSIRISEEVSEHLHSTWELFVQFEGMLEGGFSDKQRFSLTRGLGEAGSRYRSAIYKAGYSGKKKEVKPDQLKEFCSLALRFVDQSIRKNRREDGLYHAYNLGSISRDEIRIRYLYEMLEGQVAVLSAGLLSPEESLEVLDALKQSRLFREDQYSYVLYPDRQLPRFEEKNNISGAQLERSALLKKLIQDGDRSVLTMDRNGWAHFNGSFRNAGDLEQALNKLDPATYGDMLHKDRKPVLELFEELFDHQSFTGRSGTFFGYEGLGSIYWHMVSKLLLAVEECFFRALEDGAGEELLGSLKEHYYEIRAGIGLHKSPALYGAFPTDAYSHTPAHAGAKQPGLTGQVKEDFISRMGELGLRVDQGKILFEPALLNREEVLQREEIFTYVDHSGQLQELPVAAGQLVFTFCQFPVICTYGGEEKSVVHFSPGTHKEYPGRELPPEISRRIFNRDPEIRSLEFVSP